MEPTTVATQHDIVQLHYSDLEQGQDLADLIQRAFGVDGAGILLVEHVPHYEQARRRLLPLSFKFAQLRDDVKSKYVHESSYYSFGWSHGKERLQGKPDLSKGSYYANPQYDRPVDDEELISRYSSFIHPNIWPSEDLPEFENAFKELGAIIVATGKLVARQCDKYVKATCPTYKDNLLESTIEQSLCCKARLLHYFPLSDQENLSECNDSSAFSSWCGWHNDHGSLTGLTAAMYLDETGSEVLNKDPSAGLYIRNRKSELIHVTIPASCIAFQIGETAQIHSGGLLQATPHAVKGSKIRGVSRETFAVFMEPMWMEPMSIPDGVDPSSAQSQSAAANLPQGVPPLSSRWHYNKDRDQTFGEFSELTHKAYY